MTLHTGDIFSDGEVAITPSDPDRIRAVPKSADVERQAERWLADAIARGDVYYFSVLRQGELVGQILLHDIDSVLGESLVGYHLFQPCYRGLGIGTKALALLQRYAREHTDLNRLIAITSADNAASRRIAE